MLEDLETKHYKDVFDDKQSQMERVDFCECFVAKTARLADNEKQRFYTRISETDRQFAEELKVLSKKGLFGKLSHGEQYQAMYNASVSIPHLKALMAEASRDKLIYGQCRA